MYTPCISAYIPVAGSYAGVIPSCSNNGIPDTGSVALVLLVPIIESCAAIYSSYSFSRLSSSFPNSVTFSAAVMSACCNSANVINIPLGPASSPSTKLVLEPTNKFMASICCCVESPSASRPMYTPLAGLSSVVGLPMALVSSSPVV